MRVLVCRVGRLPVVETVEPDDDRPDTHLAGMQRIVGGLVDCVGITDGLDLWCHDEGILLSLPLNRCVPVCDPRTIKGGAVPVQPIFGDFFFAGTNEDGELCDVPQWAIDAYTIIYNDEDVEAAREMNRRRWDMGA